MYQWINNFQSEVDSTCHHHHWEEEREEERGFRKVSFPFVSQSKIGKGTQVEVIGKRRRAEAGENLVEIWNGGKEDEGKNVRMQMRLTSRAEEKAMGLTDENYLEKLSVSASFPLKNSIWQESSSGGRAAWFFSRRKDLEGTRLIKKRVTRGTFTQTFLFPLARVLLGSTYS